MLPLALNRLRGRARLSKSNAIKLMCQCCPVFYWNLVQIAAQLGLRGQALSGIVSTLPRNGEMSRQLDETASCQRCAPQSLVFGSSSLSNSVNTFTQTTQGCIVTSSHVRSQAEQLKYRLFLFPYFFNFFCHGSKFIGFIFC